MSFLTTKQKYLIQVFLYLIMAFVLACGQSDIYEGIYKVQDVKDTKHAGCRLELMEKGQAVWRLADNEVSFRWHVKNSEIWLSTNSGGIIIGNIKGDTITIALPGAEKMSLKKI